MRYFLWGCLVIFLLLSHPALASYNATTHTYEWTDDLHSTQTTGVSGVYDPSPKVQTKAAHMLELKDAIDQVAPLCGASNIWTAYDLQVLSQVRIGSKVSKEQLNTLRKGIRSLYSAKGQTAPSSVADLSTSTPTRIQKSHIQDMRDAMTALIPICLASSGAVCGNGVKEGTEQCDDHNLINGDGCSSTCHNETSCVLGPIANWSDLPQDYAATVANLIINDKVLCNAAWTQGTTITGNGCYSVQTGANWYEYDCGGATPVCGDGVCNVGENSSSCPADCPPGDVCTFNYSGSCGEVNDWTWGNCQLNEHCVTDTYSVTPCSGFGSNSMGAGIIQSHCAPNVSATCSDGIQNQGETGVDCGGPCTACVTACIPTGQICALTGVVSVGVGSNCNQCCSGNSDCNGGGSIPTGTCVCSAPAATCSDGIQNQSETGVDCGGPCAACAATTCYPQGTVCFDGYVDPTIGQITIVDYICDQCCQFNGISDCASTTTPSQTCRCH